MKLTSNSERIKIKIFHHEHMSLEVENIGLDTIEKVLDPSRRGVPTLKKSA